MRNKPIMGKIYSLVIESKSHMFLSVQYAHSLEEAFVLAKMEFNRINPSRDNMSSLSGAKIGLFTVKSINEMIDEQKGFYRSMREQKVVPESTSKSEKDVGVWDNVDKIMQPTPEKENNPKAKDVPNPSSAIMEEIIKRPETYEKLKRTLTKEERKYVREQIKKKVNK